MLNGKRIAILVEEGFEDSELVEPMRAMKNADARLVIVGSGTRETYRGKRGRTTVTVDTTADKVNAKDFDGIDPFCPCVSEVHRYRRPGCNTPPSDYVGRN